jgi:hypothetical protein
MPKSFSEAFLEALSEMHAAGGGHDAIDKAAQLLRRTAEIATGDEDRDGRTRRALQ